MSLLYSKPRLLADYLGFLSWTHFSDKYLYVSLFGVKHDDCAWKNVLSKQPFFRDPFDQWNELS